MDECMTSIGPRKNPDTYRITKLNSLRRRILDRIDDCAHDIDDLLEYGLKAEADYIKDVIMKDLWKQEAGLYKLICDANPDIKSYQAQEDSESESSTVTCPECGWSGDKTDSCPDCGYDFKSDNKEEDA